MQSQLAGHRFRATHIAGRAIARGTQLEIGFADKTLALNAGCNDILGAEYGVVGGRLMLGGQWETTLMGCMPDIERQEGWFVRWIGSGPELTLEGGELLTMRRNGVTARFWKVHG